MAKYLDNDGVLYLWNKVKALFNKGITGLKVSGRTITYTKGDGSTGTITTQDTTYGVVSKTANGLAPMLPNESTTTKYLRQDGSWVVPPDTKYTHPSYTAKSNGLYKVTVDGTGHVSAVVAISKEDITDLGIPSKDTTYSVASQSANGLMSYTDKKKLDGIEEGANKTVVDSVMSDASTNPVQNKIVKEYIDDKIPVPPQTNGTYYMIADVSTAGSITDINWRIPDIATSNHAGFMSAEMASKLNGFQNASAYALKNDITNMYKYKGSVPNSSNLPTSGQQVGDTYNIVNASTYGPAGTNVSWDGSKWDALGGLFEIESITNAELDEICV